MACSQGHGYADRRGNVQQAERTGTASKSEVLLKVRSGRQRTSEGFRWDWRAGRLVRTLRSDRGLLAPLRSIDIPLHATLPLRGFVDMVNSTNPLGLTPQGLSWSTGVVGPTFLRFCLGAPPHTFR